MSAYEWKSDLTAAGEALRDGGDPEIGALVAHAAHAAQALHYLADLDQSLSPSDPMPLGHDGQIVDLAHARWATGTATTALDLCAAALGRRRLGGPKAPAGLKGSHKEFSLADLANGKHPTTRATYASKLTPDGKAWIVSAWGDPGTAGIRDVRHVLAHARSTRHFETNLTVGQPTAITRTGFPVGGRTVVVDQIVVQARDVATKYVEEFLRLSLAGVL